MDLRKTDMVSDALGSSAQALHNDSSKQAGKNDEVRRSKDYRDAIREQAIKVKKNGLAVGVQREDLVETSGRDKRISPKAMMFASYVMEGHTPVTAYLKSYNAENSSHATVTSSANKLMRDPRITLLLEPLWQAKKEMILTDERIARQHIMAELFKHASAESTPINNRLRALELMGKAVGLFNDKTETLNEAIDVDTLKSDLQSSLKLLRKP